MSTRSTAWALAALTLGVAASLPSAAEAKQCVWNKSGFILRVDWFTPGTLLMETNPTDGADEYTFTDQPIQTDQVWSGSGRCIDRGPTEYWALLSACGGSFNSRVAGYPDNWPQDRRIDCSIYDFVTPSTTRWLDVWGPVWAPEVGEGGPI